MNLLDNLDYLGDLIADLGAIVLKSEAHNKAKSLLNDNGYATSDAEYGIRRIGFQLADTMKEAKRLDRMEQEQREIEDRYNAEEPING